MTALAKNASEPIPGYTLKKRIGAGGYGEVWKAEVTGDLAKAVKFVYGYLDEDRAARELKALARIKSVRHPFLLSLERIEVVEGQLLIVTELADGSLKDRYEECKKLGGVGIERAELLVYMRDAADALDYMSEHYGLQHLDVKPENLLMVGQRIKVGDFGLVKELHDVSVSMLGGLTPLYAPPELFDGQPSRHSDQYSLAIVYEEMLTGLLPFPGTTAAQLASQHLGSPPRLAPLPPGDQAVVARALSKNPEDRFENCRAFVEALGRAGVGESTQTCVLEHAVASGGEIAPFPNSRTTAANCKLGTKAEPEKPISGTAAYEPEPDEEPSQPTLAPAPERPADRPRKVHSYLTPLPPVKIDAGDDRLRPTLFIGIGGTGAAVLTRLRRRLLDKLPNEAALAAFPMLLLDVSAEALQQAAFSVNASESATFSTVAMPLRRPQDYRGDPRFHAQSTSRRWLYNIPRSLQTDGLRPLGRLALIDHLSKVCERVRAATTAMLAPETIAAASNGAGLKWNAEAPRVFLVASISGGAGSGMLIETAYAVRKVLHELKLPQELCGLLTHSAPRHQTGRDLAAANAVACLGELQQFNLGTGYPGDAACGLPAFAPETRTFDEAYLVHLGDQLAAEDFEQRAAEIAEYALLECSTSVGASLRACRAGESSPPVDAEGGLQIRSLGLTRISSADESLATSATEALCQQVTLRWLGEDPAGSEANGARSAASAILGAESQVAAKVRELALDLEPLVSALAELAGYAGGVHRAGPPPSEKVVSSKVSSWAEERAAALVAWLLAIAEDPAIRIRGAHAAAQCCVTHLRATDEAAKSTIARLEAEQAEIESILAAAESPDRSRPKGRAAPSPADLEQKRVHLEQLKPRQAMLRYARQVLQAVCGKAMLAAERLRDLSRDVQFFATQFPAGTWNEPEEVVEGNRDLAADVRAVARESLVRCMTKEAARLDGEFAAGYLHAHGGLVKLFAVAESRAALAASLRSAARSAIVQALQSVDVVGAIFNADTNPDWAVKQLRNCLDSAKPRLAAAADQCQLFVIAPAGSENSQLERLVAQQTGLSPQAIAALDADVYFCYLSAPLAVRSIATELADRRSDYIEAASRLHTRNDISWHPVVTL
jgi:hypothetical protein